MPGLRREKTEPKWGLGLEPGITHQYMLVRAGIAALVTLFPPLARDFEMCSGNLGAWHPAS